MRLSSLFAAALLAAAPALAQEAVSLTPGHEDLAPDALTYEGGTFDVRTVEPDQSIGSITQTVTMDGEYVVIVTDANAPQLGQVSRDSVRLLRSSLAPAYVVSTAPNGSVATATFDALRVVGSYGPSGRTLPIDLELKEPAFHAGGSVLASGAALVARALPFREGFVGTLETFSPTRRLSDVALTVAGREDVMRADGSTVSAWAVEESSEPGGTVQRTFYVDPDTRDLLKVALSTRGTEAVIVPADPEAMAAEAAAREALPRIAPDGTSFRPEWITPYEKTFALQLVEPQQMDVGTVTSRLSVDETAGTVTLVSVVDIPMQGGAQRDSVVAAYPSFAPISQNITAPNAAITVDFSDDAVSGQIDVEGSDPTEISEVLEQPVFASSLISEVIRGLPLAEGYEARLLGFAPGQGVVPYTIEVSGRDEATGGWTVLLSPKDAPATSYVIDPDSREILSSQLKPQIGVVIDVVPQD